MIFKSLIHCPQVARRRRGGNPETKPHPRVHPVAGHGLDPRRGVHRRQRGHGSVAVAEGRVLKLLELFGTQIPIPKYFDFGTNSNYQIHIWVEK